MSKSKHYIVAAVSVAALSLLVAPDGRAGEIPAAMPDDDLSRETLEYLRTRETARLPALADQIVDEVYGEPQIARAKIVELGLVLNAYRAQSGPSDETRDRARDLEARLFAEVESDRRARLVRRALFISASALGGTTVAGAIGIEELQDIIEEAIDVDDTLSQHQRRLDQAYFANRGMPATVSRGPKNPLATAKIVLRDLDALGLDREFTRALDLRPIAGRDVGFKRFEKTNFPGLSFAARADAGGTRVVFGLSPSMYGGAHAWTESRALEASEYARFARELAFRDVSAGGKDFAILVDPETHEAFPTRLTVEQIRGQSRVWRDGAKYWSRQKPDETRIGEHLALYALEGAYDARAGGGGEAERLMRESLLGPDKLK